MAMSAPQQRAVNELLAAERAVLHYESELGAVFDILLNEIRTVINSFWGAHGEDGKVAYTLLRRHITGRDLVSLRALLKKWKSAIPESGWPKFAALLERLLNANSITYLEELDVRTQYAIYTAYEQEKRGILALAATIALFCYTRRGYDTAQLSADGIRFKNITKAQVDQLVQRRWNDTKRTANMVERIDVHIDQLVSEMDFYIPRAVAAGRDAESTVRILTKRLDVAQGRERSLLRTEINRLVNAADMALYEAAGIEWYRYVAVLDEVTSDICRSLNDRTFRVDEAEEQINLPPMHTHCRSTTEPIITEQDEQNLLNLSRAFTFDKFVDEYVTEEFRQDILEFMSKYYK